MLALPSLIPYVPNNGNLSDLVLVQSAISIYSIKAINVREVSRKFCQVAVDIGLGKTI